jgi:hypothetical protein
MDVAPKFEEAKLVGAAPGQNIAKAELNGVMMLI